MGLSKYVSNPFKLEEDRPTPKAVYNWKVYFSGIIMSAAALEIGYDSGFIGGTVALSSFKDEFGLNLMSTTDAAFINSNIISVFHAGCFFGSIFSYYFTFYWGRKTGLIASAISMALGALLMCCASASTGLGPMYAGRVMAGLGVGSSTAIVPVYLAELSPPAIRGRVASMYEIGWRIGDTTGFFISYGVASTLEPTKKQWLIPFAVQCIPGGLYLIGVWFLIESPRWLISNGKYEKAIKNLTWLRGLDEHDEYLSWEVANIREELETQRNSVGMKFWDPLWLILKNSNLQKRLAITSSLYILQDLYGIQSINYYSPTIFQQIGVKGTTNSLLSTGIFGVVKLVSTIFWSLFVVEQYGRRTTMLFVSPICALCFFYIGAYVKLGNGGSAGKAALGLIYIWDFFFIMGWSGTPYVVGAEVYDNTIRGFCQAINSMFLWLGVFLMTRFTSQMITSMSYGIFFFFASFAVISIPWVYFMLPETRGIPLEYMDRLFSHKAWRAHKIVMEECQLEGEIEHKENMEALAAEKYDDKEQVEYVEDLEKSTKSST